MQNEDTIPGNETPAQPSPQLQAVPGYQTTSGQFTALFTVVALILGLLGFHYSPDQVEGWVQLANKLAITLGPILAIIPVIMTYVTSRGKIASNTLNANATILAAKATPVIANSGTLIEGTSAQFAGLGNPFGNFKDPQTYKDLLHIAGELGVPGAHQADAISQKVPVADLITGILDVLHKKSNK